MLFLRHASNAARKLAIPSAEFIVAVASGGMDAKLGAQCHAPYTQAKVVWANPRLRVRMMTTGSAQHLINTVNLAVALAHRLGPVVGLMVRTGLATSTSKITTGRRRVWTISAPHDEPARTADDDGATLSIRSQVFHTFLAYSNRASWCPHPSTVCSACPWAC